MATKVSLGNQHYINNANRVKKPSLGKIVSDIAIKVVLVISGIFLSLLGGLYALPRLVCGAANKKTFTLLKFGVDVFLLGLLEKPGRL